MTEFNLSDKIENTHFNEPIDMLKAEDVKEFIKELKEGIHWQMDGEMVIDLIDELAGDKLI